MNKIRMRPISIAFQMADLKAKFGELSSRIYLKKSKLFCYMTLQPSSHSDKYSLKITYSLSESPKVWLLSPEVQQYNGQYPHHLYSKNKKDGFRLCVYAPHLGEWHRNMFLSRTFIPWICTWLNTYEYWLLTGKWEYSEYKGL